MLEINFVSQNFQVCSMNLLYIEAGLPERSSAKNVHSRIKYWIKNNDWKVLIFLNNFSDADPIHNFQLDGFCSKYLKICLLFGRSMAGNWNYDDIAFDSLSNQKPLVWLWLKISYLFFKKKKNLILILRYILSYFFTFSF